MIVAEVADEAQLAGRPGPDRALLAEIRRLLATV